jgi:hypothetical protein
MLLRIVAPHFVAGVVFYARAAPIISYMESWDYSKIVWYCGKKGWKIENLG